MKSFIETKMELIYDCVVGSIVIAIFELFMLLNLLSFAIIVLGLSPLFFLIRIKVYGNDVSFNLFMFTMFVVLISYFVVFILFA